jgi:3-deoxy-D-manno-octulosonate 8-phosphate phosphatase (KDO 8-P phosphatase)
MTEKAKKIKLLLLDVDGVLTDGRIIYGDHGDELKNFNVNDGLGIMLIRRAGLKCAIITAKGSPIVKKRAKVLRIDKVYSDFHYKIEALEDIKKRFRVNNDEICYVGDDIIDIPILKRVGLAVAVNNAMDDVKKVSHYTTVKKGGKGAVREVCEMILKAQSKWGEVTRAYFE